MVEIGHNNPPSPFDEVVQEIEDYTGEAKNWCDGEPITNQAQADKVALLVQKLREAAQKAEALRKEEVKPLDEQKAEIQAKYNQLIGKTKTVTGKAIVAQEYCKKALEPWLKKVAEEQAREAEEKRLAAEKAEQEARAALEASREKADLEAREKADAELKAAEQQRKEAIKASKAKASATGGAGRALGLRTRLVAEVTDYTEAGRYMWAAHKSEFHALIADLAQQEVKAGKRNIPGVTVREERTVA